MVSKTKGWSVNNIRKSDHHRIIKSVYFLVACCDTKSFQQFLTHIYNEIYLFFRYPPADACQKLKDVLNVVDFFDDEPDIDEADELREILTHYHMKTLLQVFIFFGVLFGSNFWINFLDIF